MAIRSSQKPKIVYITPYALVPPNRGGRIRAHQLWRAMSSFGDVTPIVVGDRPVYGFRRRMKSAHAVLLPRRSYSPQKLMRALANHAAYTQPGLWEIQGLQGVPEELFQSVQDAEALARHCLNERRVERILDRVRRIAPDIVILCDTSMALLAPALRSLPRTKIVVGPHNFDSGLYESMAVGAPTETMRRWYSAAANSFADAERLIADFADQVWACSRADLDRFAALVPPSHIHILPNVVDVALPTPVPQTRNLVFVGQGGYYPNEDAALRLIEISKELDKRGVEHRLKLVGRTVQTVIDAADSAPSVEVVGEVPSTAPYLQEAALVPIALTLGGGTRLKILEAMAAGRPVISTPIGIEGIDAIDGISAIIEPNLANFADRIVELLEDPEAARRIAANGWQLVRDRYSHEALLAQMGAAFKALGVERQSSDAIFGRNIGTSAMNRVITFNPANRLLSWTFQVRSAAPFEAISAEFAGEAGVELANAFVTVKERADGAVLIDGAAVVPKSTAPTTLSIKVFAWNRLVLEEAAPAEIPEERAGLMILEPQGDEIRVVSWSNGETVTVTSAGGGALKQTCLIEPAKFGMGEGWLAKADGTIVTCETSDGMQFQPLYRPMAWLSPKRPANARLRQLENRHVGETAWLIGNGPSVRVEDLDALKGQLSFSFNRFHLAYAKTEFRPTYTVTGDRQMIEDFGQQIVDEAGGTVFVVHDEPPEILGDYIWVRMAQTFPPLFSRSAETAVSPGGSSLYMAMQIAYTMGIRKFYLYGADFKFVFEKAPRGADQFRTASGDNNHFIPNYRNGQPWCPPSLRDIGSSFNIARRIMESEGGFIRNATRGGLMEMFDRTSFTKAVAESKREQTPSEGAAGA